MGDESKRESWLWRLINNLDSLIATTHSYLFELMPPPIRLPSSNSHNSYLTRLTRVRRLQDLQRLLLSSTPLASLPLRIRPFFLFLTFLILLLLSLLGFHPTLATHLAPPSVPFSDKVLHFVCFAGATCGFYSIWIVDESVRRIWAWRWFNELVSGIVCCFSTHFFSLLSLK